MLPDQFQEDIAVFLQLRSADPVDLRQILPRLRETEGHLLQGPVVEDRERGKIRPIGDLLSIFPQDRKQICIEPAPAFHSRLEANLLFFQPSPNRLFPPQHLPGLRGEFQAAVFQFLDDQSLLEELLGEVSPLSGRIALADPVGGQFFMPKCQHLLSPERRIPAVGRGR